jgi:hypothetical protein
MPTFHPPLVEFLRTHHGIVSSEDLARLGITAGQLRAMLATGELVVVNEGVYRHVLWPDTLESHCAAACAADDRVVICCGGATRLWQVRACSRVPVHASTTSTGLVLLDGPMLHRCPVMPPEHVHDRGDGIRVTTPVRTMFDVAKHVSDLALISAIEQCLRRELFDVPALYEVGRLLCRRGRPGSTRFGEVLRSRPELRRPADSHPEIVLREALAAAGLLLEPQPMLVLPNGREIHPDLGDPSIGFYIEIDHPEWHLGTANASYDDRRDRQVRLGGGAVERVWTDEIEPMRVGLVGELLAAHRRQRDIWTRTRTAAV